MKKSRLLGAVWACLINFHASAALIDRGGGLIYDDVLDVTWLQDANYAVTSGFDDSGADSWTWDDAKGWTDQLQYYDPVRDVTWSDWRLPKSLPQNHPYLYDFSFSFDGSTDRGYNNDSINSEMNHLFYVGLGNLGYYHPSSILDVNEIIQPGGGLVNAGPFINLLGSSGSLDYFSGTIPNYHPYNTVVMTFNFVNGYQDYGSLGFERRAWAVHDGDIGAVPVPHALWLFGSGLLGLVGVAKMKYG